jgi:hypothetical protein
MTMPEITLYKEDYSDIGWRIICNSLEISPTVTDVTIEVSRAKYNSEVIEYGKYSGYTKK